MSYIQPGGRVPSELVRNDYASVNVTTGAYVQLIASTTNETNLLEIFDSSGETLVIAYGGSGAEQNKHWVNPGGNGVVAVKIPAGTRISIKAVTANATSGYFNLTLYK